MGNGDQSRKVRRQLAALQMNTKGLLELLGGDDDDRLRFWEIEKGITTPVEYRLVADLLTNLNAQLTEVQRSAETFKVAVEELAG